MEQIKSKIYHRRNDASGKQVLKLNADNKYGGLSASEEVLRLKNGGPNELASSKSELL